jgi:hydroxyacylglutathione hydrolase
MDWPATTRSNREGMTEQTAPFRDLKIDEIKKLIDDGGREVVDVREDWEWNKGHVPGARHVVLSAVLANPTAQKFRDKTIFVCLSGDRSSVASEMAVALGVKDVVNFRGGTKAWKDAGLPLEMP